MLPPTHFGRSREIYDIPERRRQHVPRKSLNSLRHAWYANHVKSKRNRTRLRRVVLIIPVEAGYFGQVLRGVISHMRDCRPWDVRVASFYRNIKDLIANWSPHGIIGAIDTWDWIEVLSLTRSPVVNISYVNPSLSIPRVGPDEEQVGRMAARHFLDSGFRHFAFVGHASVGFSDDRMKGYVSTLGNTGHTCHVFDNEKYRRQGPTHEDNLARWVRSLPKPIALLACNDDVALTMSEVCRHVRLRVPDQVALMGVDDAELICELASPPLSSIATAPERVGYEAAALLERLMSGKAPPEGPVLLPPARVVTRQSTDVLAVEDADLRRALRYIRDHAHRPIGIPDLVRDTCVSRRLLERRFHKALGRSPQQEIRRVRIERAKDLLARPELPMYAVAERCGFASPQRFCAAFRKETGQTPGQFRAEIVARPLLGA